MRLKVAIFSATVRHASWDPAARVSACVKSVIAAIFPTVVNKRHVSSKSTQAFVSTSVDI